MPRNKWTLTVLSLIVGTFSPLLDHIDLNATSSTPGEAAVHPLFDLSSPKRSPSPSDRFTVADPNQNTGRRVALPMPLDCVAHASECHDVTFLNHLDGFNTIPRISIPFDGHIDVSTATSENVFIVSLGDALTESGEDASEYWGESLPRGSIGQIVGINQVVWDPETLTLHATADESLDEHARYALVITRGVRDTTGRPIEASQAFQQYRFDLAATADPELRWYRRALLTAEWAGRRAAVRHAASVRCVVRAKRHGVAEPEHDLDYPCRRFRGRVSFYRHDRYWADNPTIPKNPHGFFSQLVPLIPAYVSIVRGAQAQVAEFFRSDGTNVIHPEPRLYWEVPIAGPRPEDLGYIR